MSPWRVLGSRSNNCANIWGSKDLQNRLQRHALILRLGLFLLTVTVTTMGYRSYKNPLNEAPLRTGTGRGNDPTYDAERSPCQGQLQ